MSSRGRGRPGSSTPGPPAARGRGRGAARSSLSRQLSSDEEDASYGAGAGAGKGTTTPKVEEDDDDSSFADAPTSRASSSVASTPAPAAAGSSRIGAGRPTASSTGGSTLLRKNVYTGANKMKFMPQMVKRKVKEEQDVKEEELDISLTDLSASRGRGRGRGARGGRGEGHMQPRGRGEVILTASGAFAQGPSMAERAQSSRGRALGASVMSGGSGGGGGGAGGSGGGGARTSTSTANLVDSDPEDYKGDDTYDQSGAKVVTVDLFDIGLEGEMAPLVLPRDEKKWQEEELLRKENERAMAKIRGKPDPYPDGVVKKEEGSGEGTAKPKIKLDPEEEEERMAASLRGTPATITSGTESRAQSVSSSSVRPEDETQEAGAGDAAVLGIDDVKIKVKKEDISGYFARDDLAHFEQFYIFQFPRLFPQFCDTEARAAAEKVKNEESGAAGEDVKPSPFALGAGNASSAFDPTAKHKVRSAYHESESEAWRDYEPGKWQGWGRNPGRDDREAIAGKGSEKLEGRIGKIKVRQSGKTTMKLGGIEYEILPGAPASFLQEIAVLDTDTEGKPGMFVMGQTSKKFIITPDLPKLLTQDRNERAVHIKRQKEEEATLAAKVKEEQLEADLRAAKKKVTAPAAKKAGTAAASGAAKPRPKPAAAAAKPAPAKAGTSSTAGTSKAPPAKK